MATSFRLFVCSTFEDFILERDELHKRVFPKLGSLCNEHGCELQVIDLRWGIREEASLDHRTIEICFEEIARCREAPRRSLFLVLLGDRYGWRPLPAEIPLEEFRELLRCAPEGRGEEMLQRWYRCDQNAVPPVYRLRPREAQEPRPWEETENELREVLVSALETSAIPEPRRWKYQSSATEQEIRGGVFSDPEALGNTFCFFRTPSARAHVELRRPRDGSLRPDLNAAERLVRLKDELRRRLPGDRLSDFDHLSQLCDDVLERLSARLREQIDPLQPRDSLDEEIRVHESFGREHLLGSRHLFSGRGEVLNTLLEALRQSNRRPLALRGSSGIGKTAVAERTAELLRASNPEICVVRRFLGATPRSMVVRSMIEDLCREIARGYGAESGVSPAGEQDLGKLLLRHLGLATPERPLAVILDALDQLSAADQVQGLGWLPVELPAHTELLVTCSPGTMDQALIRRLPAGCRIDLSPMTREEGEELLSAWLEDAGRCLQPEQRRAVVDRFADSGLPLFLLLAFEEARHWRSWDPVPDLGRDVPDLMKALVARLSSQAKHGPALVSASLGYLAAARDGLSETELLDVLSHDPEIARDLADASRFAAPGGRLPHVLWSRLYFDLRFYLTRRPSPGAELLTFFHRQLREVIAKLSPPGRGERSHRALASYFSELQGGARLRRLSELPFQQAHGFLWNDLEETLSSLRFLEEKAEAGLVYDLAHDFDLALERLPADRPARSLLRLVQQGVHADLGFLARRPGSLFQCLWNRCWWAGGGARDLLEPWLEQARRARRSPWMRSLRPPPDPAGSSQLAVLEGHRCPVQVVAFSPEGSRIASGSANLTDRIPFDPSIPAVHGGRRLEVVLPKHLPGHEVDNSLRIWEAATGLPVRSYAEVSDGVFSVAFSPDGHRILVSGAKDGRVAILDLALERVLVRFYGHSMAARAAFSPDGERVVSGALDGSLWIWKARNGAALTKLRGHRSAILCVAFSPDGRRVASSSGYAGRPHDNSLRIWDAGTGRELFAFERGDGQGILGIAFSPDGERIAAGSVDSTIYLYGLAERQEVLLGRHRAPVLGVAFSPDGRRLASGSIDRSVRIWDVAERLEVARFLGHRDVVNSVAFSPDGRRLASGSADCSVRLWNAEAAGQPPESPDPDGDIFCLEFSADGERLVTGSQDGTARVWDRQGSPIAVCRVGGPVTRVGITPDGRRVVASDGASLQVFDAERGEELFVLWRSSAGNSLRMFDPKTMKEVLRSFGPSSETDVTSLALSADGRRVACGLWNGELRIWRLDDGAEIFHGRDGRQARHGVDFLPWERRVVLACEVTCLAFSRDDRHLVSGCRDGTVRVWLASEREGEVSALQVADLFAGSAVDRVAFSPDGSRIVSRGAGDTVATWSWRDGGIERRPAKEDGGEERDGQEWRAVARGLETVVLSPDGEAVGWYPGGLVGLRKHPREILWAGAEGNHLHLVQLEEAGRRDPETEERR